MGHMVKGDSEAFGLQKLTQKRNWILFYESVKLSVAGVIRVLSKWNYALIALATIFVFSMVFGVLSVGTSEWNLLMSGLPLADKFAILTRGVVRVFTHIESPSDLLLITVVVLQGIAIALLAYTISQQRQSARQQSNIEDGTGESTVASLLATIGLGCSACGTSLAAPVISLISSSTVFLGIATTFVMFAAIALLLYSIRKMGHTAYIFTSIKTT